MNLLKSISSKIFLLFCIWFLIHSVFITYDGFQDRLERSDVGIVLGNMVQDDGKPSLRLKSRLEKTILLYHNQYFQNIIVSGGIGENGFDEAKVMKDYLVSDGIPEKAIIVDSEGTNTYLTAVQASKIMKANHFESALVISQFYHISRIRLAFAKLSIHNLSSAHAEFVELRDFYSVFREFFAYYRYLVFL